MKISKSHYWLDSSFGCATHVAQNTKPACMQQQRTSLFMAIVITRDIRPPLVTPSSQSSAHFEQFYQNQSERCLTTKIATSLASSKDISFMALKLKLKQTYLSQIYPKLTGIYSSKRPPGNIPYNLGPRLRSDKSIVITESVIFKSLPSWSWPYIRSNTWLGSWESGVWVDGREQ